MKNTFEQYKGFTIETTPKQELDAQMQTSIINDANGISVGATCSTRFGEIDSIQKAKNKIDNYKK